MSTPHAKPRRINTLAPYRESTGFHTDGGDVAFGDPLEAAIKKREAKKRAAKKSQDKAKKLKADKPDARYNLVLKEHFGKSH